MNIFFHKIYVYILTRKPKKDHIASLQGSAVGPHFHLALHLKLRKTHTLSFLSNLKLRINIMLSSSTFFIKIINSQLNVVVLGKNCPQELAKKQLLLL